MNLTLEQFLANVRNFFMTFSKDTFSQLVVKNSFEDLKLKKLKK